MPTYDITFDVPPSGDRNQGMWLVWEVLRGKKGRWNREEQAQDEANKRNKALGWGPEWTGGSDD